MANFRQDFPNRKSILCKHRWMMSSGSWTLSLTWLAFWWFKFRVAATKQNNNNWHEQLHPHFQAQTKASFNQDAAPGKTVRPATLSKMRSTESKFERCFTDFASVEPVGTSVCFPFATDIVMEDIASSVLDTTTVENWILIFLNSGTCSQKRTILA